MSYRNHKNFIVNLKMFEIQKNISIIYQLYKVHTHTSLYKILAVWEPHWRPVMRQPAIDTATHTTVGGQ